MVSFMREVNSLDWTNLADWEKLPDLLNDAGISLPITELEAFIQEASASAQAIRKIDFTKVAESMSELQSLVKNLRSGDGGREISASEYEKLAELNPAL
jgi:uncharacterized protein YpuA (DUF1002 family)